MLIQRATDNDFEAMLDIFQRVIATGDTLPFSLAQSDQLFRAQWFGGDKKSFVAMHNSEVLGMYQVGANYPGFGSHVASATYLVSPAAQGRGIGTAMVKHSLAQAAKEGYNF